MSRRAQDIHSKRPAGQQLTVLLLAVMSAAWLGGGVVPRASVFASGGAATYYVNGDPSIGSDTNDCAEESPMSGQANTGPCLTIGGAIAKASSTNVVDIAGSDANFNGVYCEQITIDESQTLEALDPSNPPAIDGGAGGTNSCANAPYYETSGHSVVTLGDANKKNIAVALRSLTIQHGDASNNTADTYHIPGEGGGIFAYPGVTLVMANSTVSGNTACSTSACAVGGDGGFGGAIYTAGHVTLTGSTVSGNVACSTSGCAKGYGGGIFSYYSSSVTVTNSTLGGNTGCFSSSCVGAGGGIFAEGTTSLVNSTVSGNAGCSSGSSGCHAGGIDETSPVVATLSNTILAGNYGAPASPDCLGSFADGNPDGTIVGRNIIGDSAGCTVSGLTTNDQINVDPLLGPLQDNGGPTFTMALGPTSPAVGAADRPTCALATLGNGDPGPNGEDQRGEPRSAVSCDVGAYQAIPNVYVAATGDDGNPCAVASTPCRHISAGIAIVESGGTVNVAGGIYCERVVVDRSMMLQGNGTGSNPVVIDGGGAVSSNPCPTETPGHSVLMVGDANSTTMTVTLQGLTIQHGDAFNNPIDTYDSPGQGGGIFVYPGVVLTVRNSAVRDNAACSAGCTYGDGGGGGILNFGTTTLVASTVSGNTACRGNSCGGEGGGIETVCASGCSGGALTLVNSTVSANLACNGGSCGGDGGGILSLGGGTTLINSTVSANTGCIGSSCTVQGGGFYGASSTPAYLSNSILAGNSGASGSPDCSGSVLDGQPYGSTVVGNNIVGNSAGCTVTGLTSNDQVGTSSSPFEPKLGPLQDNGGATLTMAPGPTSPAIGAADPTTCDLATITYESSGTAPGPNGEDQRGDGRYAQTRQACDIGAYDTGGAVAISQGWNLIGVPFQSSSTGSASGLAFSINGELGGLPVKAIATYSRGAFHLYVPGYTADQTLSPSQGIFVLSGTSGLWFPLGTAYTGSQVVNVQRGWNLVAAPYPYRGLNGDDLKTELGPASPNGCGLKEAALYAGGSFHTYTPATGPAGTAFHVPNTLGMFVECTNAFTWTPS